MLGVSAIVPAAGLARRMGGTNKLLQPWKGGTVIGAVVRTLLHCGLDVVVVTGYQAEEVRAAVEPTRTIHHAGYADGLGSSIAAGAAACPSADGFLIALGDMPGLCPEVVLALLSRFDAKSIVAPVYETEPNRLGHPVLFGSDFRDELLALQGDTGARSIVASLKQSLIRVPVPGRLEDLDRPEDFLKSAGEP